MKLKELRESKKITQAELGKALAISTSTIGMYEQGRRNPDPEMLKKIADYFNVSIDYLLGHKSDEYDKLSNENLPKLNKKDKKDISKILDALVNDLDGKGAVAFYNGDEELDDETRALIAQSLKVSAVIAKQKAKEKFTPKKYKKNDNE